MHFSLSDSTVLFRTLTKIVRGHEFKLIKLGLWYLFEFLSAKLGGVPVRTFLLHIPNLIYSFYT